MSENNLVFFAVDFVFGMSFLRLMLVLIMHLKRFC